MITMSNMSKAKLDSVDIRINGDNIVLDVHFKDVPCKLSTNYRATGLGLQNILRSAYNYDDFKYKLVKNDDHIRLISSKTNPNLKGLKKLVNGGYYPLHGDAQESVLEAYGSNFSYEIDGHDIKLFPIFIDEEKQIKLEILKAIKRYNTENNLIKE